MRDDFCILSEEAKRKGFDARAEIERSKRGERIVKATFILAAIVGLALALCYAPY